MARKGSGRTNRHWEKDLLTPSCPTALREDTKDARGTDSDSPNNMKVEVEDGQRETGTN